MASVFGFPFQRPKLQTDYFITSFKDIIYGRNFGKFKIHPI